MSETKVMRCMASWLTRTLAGWGDGDEHVGKRYGEFIVDPGLYLQSC